MTLTRRVDDNWFEGRIANRKGIFPVSYVEVLQEIGAEVHVKPIGAPAAHSLVISPTVEMQPKEILNVYASTNGSSGLSNGGHRITNGNEILRETKTSSQQKTDVLYVDTNTEPIK